MSAGRITMITQRGRRAVAVVLAIGLTAGLTVVGPGTETGASALAAPKATTPAPTLTSEAATARARLAQLPAPTTTVAHPAADHAGSSAPVGAASAGTAAERAAAAHPDASTGPPVGLDVSSYQGNVAWSTVAQNGASFAYVKATENLNYTNPYFTQQYNGSVGAGLIRGAYHYAIPSASTGAAQADYFVANGGGWTNDGQTLPGAVDLESGSAESLPECYGLSQPAMVTWVSSFVTEYHNLTSRYPVIYAGYYWWSDCTGASSSFNNIDPLWFPRYASAVGSLPSGWSSYAIWQNADSGVYPGDQDQFNGSAADLASLATGGAVAPVCIGTLGHEAGVQPAVTGITSTPDGKGYWMVDAKGGVAACGDAVFQGSPGSVYRPIVGVAAGPDNDGYYLVGSDGGIFTYGSATFRGSAGNIALAKPIVGMASNAAGTGYWLVASDGGIFTYGVPFFGSAGNIALAKPVVGMATDPATGGYWLVASDGGIFTYNAPFRGSAGNLRLARPVVGMTPDLVTGGYLLVASDGGIFSYGATFYGSAGNLALASPIVGMGTPPTGVGYWLAGGDGGIFSYGAPFEGSAA